MVNPTHEDSAGQRTCTQRAQDQDTKLPTLKNLKDNDVKRPMFNGVDGVRSTGITDGTIIDLPLEPEVGLGP